MIIWEYQNTEPFLLKDILQTDLKNFLWSKKLKIQFHGDISLMILMVKKLLEYFIKKPQKTKRNGFRMEKVIKKKGNKLYVKWKGYDNWFNGWINEKDSV